MDITVANPQRIKIPLTSRALSKAAEAFLVFAGVRSASLSIVFVVPGAMRRLNKVYLGHDFPTDIITFDLNDKKRHLIDGELVICPAEARRNAAVYGEPLAKELLRYLAHGILHLLGHDDGTPQKRAAMRIKEDEMLSWLSSQPKL